MKKKIYKALEEKGIDITKEDVIQVIEKVFDKIESTELSSEIYFTLFLDLSIILLEIEEVIK